LFPQGQNLWGNGCAELAFFDADSTQTAVFPFPHDAPNGTLQEGNSALIATRAFADLPGAPRPDFIIPQFVAASDGKVCFRGSNCLPINICTPVPKADFGDPLHATDYRLCVYDDGPALRLEAA